MLATHNTTAYYFAQSVDIILLKNHVTLSFDAVKGYTYMVLVFFYLFTDNLKSNRRGDDEDEEEMDDEKDLRLMGVDEAIIYSIEKCGMQCSILCHLFS